VGTVLKMGGKVNKGRMGARFRKKAANVHLSALNGRCCGSELRAWAKADRIRAGQGDYERARTSLE
jgi:hypothetical protein